MLEARNISYKRNHRSILDQCSIQVIPGKFTAIAGANGAGKTSLMKILSREITPNEGLVELNKKNIASLDFRDLSCERAVLPQHSTISFPFTVKQIVSAGRYPHYTTRAQNEVIIGVVLAQMNLAAFSDRVYQTLSGGEQQRVQLARVMVQLYGQTESPKYLLLDEPTSSLDLAQQHAMLDIAKNLCDHGVGVVAILHDLNLVAQYADHVHFLKDGKTVAQGPVMMVMTHEIIEETFQQPVRIIFDELSHRPVVYATRKMNYPFSPSKIKSHEYHH